MCCHPGPFLHARSHLMLQVCMSLILLSCVCSGAVGQTNKNCSLITYNLTGSNITQCPTTIATAAPTGANGIATNFSNTWSYSYACVGNSGASTQGQYASNSFSASGAGGCWQSSSSTSYNTACNPSKSESNNIPTTIPSSGTSNTVSIKTQDNNLVPPDANALSSASCNWGATHVATVVCAALPCTKCTTLLETPKPAYMNEHGL